MWGPRQPSVRSPPWCGDWGPATFWRRFFLPPVLLPSMNSGQTMWAAFRPSICPVSGFPDVMFQFTYIDNLCRSPSFKWKFSYPQLYLPYDSILFLSLIGVLTQVKTPRQRWHFHPWWHWYQKRRCLSVSMPSLSQPSLWPRSEKSTINWTARLLPNRSERLLLVERNHHIILSFPISHLPSHVPGPKC